jgi:hypothetical protein
MMPFKSKLDDAVTGQAEMILVPRTPTPAMLKAGWASANEEDTAGVWRDMIEEWVSSHQQGELGQR